MASVLAREAADLRRRCESLPAALRPAPSAQAPWAGRAGSEGGARSRPAALGLQRTLSPAPMTAEHAHVPCSRATV